MKKALSLVAFVLTVVFAGAYVVLAVANGGFGSTEEKLAGFGVVVTMLAYAGVGLLLTLHRPENPIGWLLFAFAGVLAARTALEEYALAASADGSLVQVQRSVVVINGLEHIGLAALVTLVVLFPSGRVSSRLWRFSLVLVWVLAALALLTAPFAVYATRGVELPALHSLAGAEHLAFFLTAPAMAVLLAAMVRIVVLLFRGTEAERHQIRWVAYVLAVTLALLAVAAFIPIAGVVAGLVAAVGIPIAVGIAVTKYRLYDIDRIVNRTVVYAIVIGVLALVFAGLAALPTILVGSGNAPSWVIAASTLAVAALFNPLRRRVQRFVDRRFHRTPYDQEQVADALASALRDEVDPGLISTTWSGTVETVLQPALVGVWVRERP